MKPLRPWKEVLSDWASEVASKLERPEAELQARGLSATDFSSSQAVEIRLTGVTHRFNSAFAVIRPDTGEVAVFSEHAGYVEFHLSEDDVVAEISEEIYRHDV